MLIEIHMLKNYAPTNLNRDDTGAPKTCQFGGVQRSRISSQCLKYSWRSSDMMKEVVGKQSLGIRTCKLPERVCDELLERGIPDEYVETLKKIISGFGNKEGKENKNPNKTAQVILFAPEDIKAVADLIEAKLKDCADVKDVGKLSAKGLQEDLANGIKRAVTPDMALFGRMVTSDAFADVEASMQVAHAIGTNRVLMESDYFTAVDDLIQGSDNERGSAMIGDVDYNSSCYYIYASLDTDKLRANLTNYPDKNELMKQIIPALIEVMAHTDPSGKQNSFESHPLPSAILIECKEKKRPVSYANAFEVPVTANRNCGLIRGSVMRLKDECETMVAAYELPVIKRLWFTTEKNADFNENMAVNCKTFHQMLGELPEM